MPSIQPSFPVVILWLSTIRLAFLISSKLDHIPQNVDLFGKDMKLLIAVANSLGNWSDKRSG